MRVDDVLSACVGAGSRNGELVSRDDSDDLLPLCRVLDSDPPDRPGKGSAPEPHVAAGVDGVVSPAEAVRDHGRPEAPRRPSADWRAPAAGSRMPALPKPKGGMLT